jgi:hypothetical protein
MAIEVTASQAAEIISTSYVTIHRRVDDGLLQARRQGLNRMIMIEIEELRRFANEYGYRFNEEAVPKK